MKANVHLPERYGHMRVKVLNKYYDLIYVDKSTLGTDRGSCDSPDTKSKKIRVRNNLKEQEKLEIEIHEFLHAADWYKDEEWVRDTAHDLAKMLWRIGYRDTPE